MTRDYTVEWGGEKGFIRQAERGGRKGMKRESMEESGSDSGELDQFNLI